MQTIRYHGKIYASSGRYLDRMLYNLIAFDPDPNKKLLLQEIMDDNDQRISYCVKEFTVSFATALFVFHLERKVITKITEQYDSTFRYSFWGWCVSHGLESPLKNNLNLAGNRSYDVPQNFELSIAPSLRSRAEFDFDEYYLQAKRYEPRYSEFSRITEHLYQLK